MTQLCRNVRQIELRGIAIHDRKTWSIMRAKDAIAHKDVYKRQGVSFLMIDRPKRGPVFSSCFPHCAQQPFS